jgi:hypothetical protein
MIQRRPRVGGLKTRIDNHTFRATGITTYLNNNSTAVPFIANDESPRTQALMLGGLLKFRLTRLRRSRFKGCRCESISAHSASGRGRSPTKA